MDLARLRGGGQRRHPVVLKLPSLRTLLVVMVLSALIVIGWTKWLAFHERRKIEAIAAENAKRHAQAIALLREVLKAQEDLRIGSHGISPEKRVRLKAILEGEQP